MYQHPKKERERITEDRGMFMLSNAVMIITKLNLSLMH